MTGARLSTDQPDLPAPLAEYADRLLLSTGLHAEDALRIARGDLEPPEELALLARALRAGWDLMDELL
jgi:hypothetical protein